MKMAPVLIQGIAALEPATFEEVLTRVTRLKIIKSTRNMDTRTEEIFLEDISEHIFVKNFNYQFIDQGIFKLIEDPKNDKWFPDLSVILSYIGKEHILLKIRIMMLSELLMRRREQLLLEKK